MTNKASTRKPALPNARLLTPVKEVFSKTALVAHIAAETSLAAKDVRAVLSALAETAQASVHKNGVGQFTMPGVLKITAVQVPAKPKRKGINPFTKEEQWFAAKPATVKLKIRALKKLKDAAL
ncbi:HU family DNA-binding protein [Dyella japonica]